MASKPPKGESLAEVNPILAKDWHSSKNGQLTPFDFAPKSNKVVWWKCPQGDDHEWKAKIYSRTAGNGCPVCSGKMAVQSNCLATINPILASQWHPSKNNGLTPYEVTPNSGKKVWWKCPEGNDHEWMTSVTNRTRGRGCPICSNKMVVESNSLMVLNPKLSSEWHPSKNNPLTPRDVTPGSNKRVWWQCSKNKDHVWNTSVVKRTSGQGCPSCYELKPKKGESLAETNKVLAQEFHPTKNGNLTVHDIFPTSHKKIWWKCPEGKDHEWEATIASRTYGNGCPICSRRKVVPSNCLASTNPSLASQWHPSKNNNLSPYDITEGSRKIVWWKCPDGQDHEWRAQIRSRSIGRGCPICSNQMVVPSNSLAIINPLLAKQWHPKKNGDLSPFDVVAKSGKRVWWKCDKGEDHEWLATPNTRSKDIGCPICSNRKAVRSNSLAILAPDIAKEWHPTKNGDLTAYDVVPNSHKRVWWKCPKGDDHEWKTSLNARNSGTGCPICANLKVVKSNCLATLKPDLAKEWHPTKNGNLTPYDVTPGSGKKVWWQCFISTDHFWKTSIGHRGRGHGCPFCTLTPQSRQELTITFELKQFYRIDPRGFKTRINGKLMTIDIYIPKFNLGIEFDGSYWHKGNREFDKMKSLELINSGFDLLRIREEPLKPINEFDIVSKKPFNPKEITDNILKFILDRYDLPDNLVIDIKGYFRKRKVQNEEELDKYIDQILEEKAAKKKKKKVKKAFD